MGGGAYISPDQIKNYITIYLLLIIIIIILTGLNSNQYESNNTTYIGTNLPQYLPKLKGSRAVP